MDRKGSAGVEKAALHEGGAGAAGQPPPEKAGGKEDAGRAQEPAAEPCAEEPRPGNGETGGAPEPVEAGEPQAGQAGAPHEGEPPAEDPEVAGLKARIAELEAELEAKNRLLQEEEDRYLRLRAEFENFRRRTRQEVEQIRANAAEHLVLRLLPVVDNLERAVAAAATAGHEAKALVEGVEMVLKQFLSELSKVGVRPVEALGARFDPRFHEAVMYEESDEAEGTVIEEFQKGYLLNDKLLRPSMVKVAKAR